MKGEVVQDVRDAVHEALRIGSHIDCYAQPGDAHDDCDAIAGDLIMELRRRGLTVAKMPSRARRKFVMERIQ